MSGPRKEALSSAQSLLVALAVAGVLNVGWRWEAPLLSNAET